MKLTIKGNVTARDKKKDGSPMINKYGKPFQMASFKVKEEVLGQKDKYLSGYYDEIMEGWGDGTVIYVDVTQNGEYLNFKLMKEVSREEFEELKAEVERLKKLASREPDVYPYPEI